MNIVELNQNEVSDVSGGLSRIGAGAIGLGAIVGITALAQWRGYDAPFWGSVVGATVGLVLSVAFAPVVPGGVIGYSAAIACHELVGAYVGSFVGHMAK